MPRTYLKVPFPQKDAAKSLGAKWAATIGSWYVPETVDLTPFGPWMSGSLSPALVTPTPSPHSSTSLAEPSRAMTALAVGKFGVPLARLFAGVANAVASAYKAGVWTTVEVTDVKARGGHVYLELSERDKTGTLIAKATGMIWAATANRILPEFERATGATLAPGIKLLVRARPVYKPQFGFSLDIDAIDPDYNEVDRWFGERSKSGRRRVLLDEPFPLEFAPEIPRDRRLHRIPVLFYLPVARSTHYDGNRLEAAAENCRAAERKSTS